MSMTDTTTAIGARGGQAPAEPRRRPLGRGRAWARRRLQALRHELAAALLGDQYFVQIHPNCVRTPGTLARVRPAIRRYDGMAMGASHLVVRDGVRVLELVLLLDEAARLDGGDYAELGTWRGASARILFERRAPGTELHCFDTFEGFDLRDVATERGRTTVRTRAGQFANTTLEQARRTILGRDAAHADPRDPSGHGSDVAGAGVAGADGAGADGAALHLHQGFFPDTFAGLEQRRWRLVHLDADLYAPTRAALERFWPRMVPGGILLVHDYNSHFAGTRQAVDEYFAPLGLDPVPLCDKAGSVVLRKPRQG